MKALLTTALLLAGSLLAHAQPAGPAQPGSALQVGYVRELFKARDLQASPVLYIANLNGLRLSYTRVTARNQWHAGVQAGRGAYIAPALGIRSFKFSPDQATPLRLAPTLYRGSIELAYRRNVRQKAHRTTWVGLGVHDVIGYADGVAMSTWAMHSLAAQLLYQERLTLSRKHTLVADASLPVLAAVSRMPYGNVVSEPGRSNTSAFLGGTRLASPLRFLNPQVGLAYRFECTARLAFRVSYQYSWMRYPEPRVIRSASHTVAASLMYKFQMQHRSSTMNP
ncbi:MAG: hypothetical protein ICV83_01555 [Cytophagales bacterium]|nr:hypothetical protein [Cytophagales bacterium]